MSVYKGQLRIWSYSRVPFYILNVDTDGVVEIQPLPEDYHATELHIIGQIEYNSRIYVDIEKELDNL